MGRVDDPYRDAVGDPAGPCPRCTDVLLAPLAMGPTHVSACRSCGGVFVDRDTLERFAGGDTGDLRALADEATRAPPRPRTLPLQLECPRCQTPMRRVLVPRARCEIDVCPAHGAWFDRWEIQVIADAMRDEDGAAALRVALRG